jgi:hypothetical protein
VVSTLVLLFALFIVQATSVAEPGPPISALVLLPGVVGCFVGWFGVFSASDDRAVATGLSVFVALAADAATLWPIFTRW